MVRKEDKHTPSDNRRQKVQHGNLKGGQNPQTSGDSFNDIEKEAFDSRRSGRNESGKFNKPTRGTGEQGGGERDKKR
jgi:hypothetical protein